MVRQSCSISEPNFDVSQDEMHKRERERERERINIPGIK